MPQEGLEDKVVEKTKKQNKDNIIMKFRFTGRCGETKTSFIKKISCF